MRVPYCIEDPKRDPNLENYPHVGCRVEGLGFRFPGYFRGFKVVSLQGLGICARWVVSSCVQQQSESLEAGAGLLFWQKAWVFPCNHVVVGILFVPPPH